MDSLRIGFIVDKCEPFFVGGYETRYWNLARVLSRQHEVRIFTSIEHSETELGRIHFERVSPTLFQLEKSGERSLLHSLIYSVELLRNPTKRWNPDVLVVEAIPYLHLATMLSWIKRVPAARVLNVNEAWTSYQYERILPGTLSSGLLKRLLLVGISWADLVLAISKTTKTSLETSYGLSRVELVPMGLDFEKIASYTTTSSHDPTYDFVSVGRLVRPKRHADFVEALGLLRRSNHWNGSACMIGNGPMMKQLKRRSDELGLSENLDIVGFVSEERKFALLKKSKVFVLPSEREGFATSALEALSCGLPAIVARPEFGEVFGVSDYVVDRVSGRLYPVGNVRELADTMAELVADPAELKRMGLNAREIASRYDWSVIGEQLGNTLGNLLRS